MRRFRPLPFRRPAAGLLEKSAKVPQETTVALGIEERVEARPARAAALIQLLNDRPQRRLGFGRQSRIELLQVDDQDIEIADCAQRPRDPAQTLAVLGDCLWAVVRRKQVEKAAHTAERNAHLVNGFDVFAGTAAGFMPFHAAQLARKELATGFRHRIAGQNLGPFRPL